MNTRLITIVLLFSIATLSCSLAVRPEITPTVVAPATPTEATPTAADPTAPEATPTLPATETPLTPTPTIPDVASSPLPTPDSPDLPDEAIMILEPASGSRAVSPVRVSGIADPTFEQNLVIRILLDDGTQIAIAPTTIAADMGQRGPFTVAAPFEITGERQAFIQVYTESARDGGVTHLSSVGVTIADSGPDNILQAEPHQERIAIFNPAPNSAVGGGTVRVEGFGLASFEQNLLIEVLDEDGNVVGSQPVMVQAPDLGFPGPFEATIPYQTNRSGAGRILVRDISPAHGDNTHVSSVEVGLEP